MAKPLRSVHDRVMIQETHFKSFYNLVEVSVEYRNIQILTTEVDATVNEICYAIITVHFSFREKQIQPQKFQRNEAAEK